MNRHAGHINATASRVRLGLLALALAAVLGVMAVGIALTHERAKSQIVVFLVIAILALLVVLLFARSISARRRLNIVSSEALEGSRVRSECDLQRPMRADRAGE